MNGVIADGPLPVLVALLPSTKEAANLNSPVPAEFQTAIARYNINGKPLTAAEHARYLVEVACPERWLLPLMKRAGAGTNNGVVKLCYGCGYETTVVVGNADARQAPTGQLAVGITVHRVNATVKEIGNVWIAGSESVWCFVAGSNVPAKEQTCLFICTSNQRFMIPALPEKELEKRKRMIRVWPASDDPSVIEKMEEIRLHQNHEPSSSSAVSRLPCAPPPVAAKSRSTGSISTKKPDATAVAQGDNKKNKTKKDPNMPRKGKTTYNFFMEANRRRVIAENPNAKDYKEIQRKLTEEYKSLSKDEMQKYVAMSKNDKENQDKAIAEYLLQKGLNGRDVVPKTARKKDANAPKNPKNAYLYYSQEQRPIVKAANPTASFGELGRLIGIAYKALTQEEMAKYEALAKADKARYLTEMEAYKREGNGSRSNVKTGKGLVDGQDDDGNNKSKPVAEREREDADSDSSSDETSESSGSSSSSSSASHSKKRKITE